MDFLQRQDRTEAGSHNDGGSSTLSSSYFEGLRYPLAHGATIETARKKLQVNYGLLTKTARFGVGLQRQHGDPRSPRSRRCEALDATHRFGRRRGMITQSRSTPRRDRIAALRPEAIKKLIPAGQVRCDCSERNLFRTRTFPVSGWWPVATLS